MKVWVVSGGWNYEGTHVIGVFSSEEGARASIERWRKEAAEDAFAPDYVEMLVGDLDGGLDETCVIFKKDGKEYQSVRNS